MTDSHEVLGLPEDAGPKAIKHRHRELAKRYHPDRNPGDETAQWMFQQVQAAYEKLTARTAGPTPLGGHAQEHPPTRGAEPANPFDIDENGWEDFKDQWWVKRERKWRKWGRAQAARDQAEPAAFRRTRLTLKWGLTVCCAADLARIALTGELQLPLLISIALVTVTGGIWTSIWTNQVR